MPRNDIVKLRGKSKVPWSHDVFALESVAAAGTQLRRNVVEIRVPKTDGAGLTQVVQYLPYGIARFYLCFGNIGNIGAIPVCMPVVDPADVVSLVGSGAQRKPAILPMALYSAMLASG